MVILPSSSVRTTRRPRMLAGDQPALAVHGVAVGVIGWRAEDAQVVVVLQQPHLPVVRDVAENQVAAGAEIGRPLGPAEAGGDPLDRAGAGAALEALGVNRLDMRDRDSGSRATAPAAVSRWGTGSGTPVSPSSGTSAPGSKLQRGGGRAGCRGGQECASVHVVSFVLLRRCIRGILGAMQAVLRAMSRPADSVRACAGSMQGAP